MAVYPDPVILLDAVEPGRQADAERELKDFTREVFANRPHPVLVIAVTGDFAGVVERVGRNFGGLDPGSPPYDQLRSHVMAVAKTIPCKIERTLGFAIILDGAAFAPECFKQWSPGMAGYRKHLLVHEMVHAADMWAEAAAQGIDPYIDSERRWQDRKLTNATAIWQEYHAVRFATEAMAPWSHDLAQGQGFEATIRNLLEGLPGFFEQQILQFRLWRLTVEGYLLQVMPRINQLLILWSYLLGMEDAGVKFDDAYKESRAYHAVLAPADPLVRPILQELYRDQWRYRPELLADLGGVVDLILEKLSVRFEPLADGQTYARILGVDF